MDIFPLGWCETNGHPLSTPRRARGTCPFLDISGKNNTRSWLSLPAQEIIYYSKHLLSYSFRGSEIWAQLSWALWVHLSQGCNQGVSQGSSPLKALQGEELPSLCRGLLARIHFLVDYWTEGLSSLLTVGWRLPSVPCHVGLFIGERTAWQLVSISQQVSKSKTD